MSKVVEMNGEKLDKYDRERAAFTSVLSIDDKGNIKEEKKMAGIAASLPEHLDMKTKKEYDQAYNGALNGFIGASSNLAATAFQNDKALDKVTGEVALSEGNTTRITIRREEETRNPRTGEKGIKHFAVQVSSKHRGPDYENIRKELSENWEKLL